MDLKRPDDAIASPSRSSSAGRCATSTPHARELGSDRELEGIQTILDRGNSSERQLRICNANRDIREIVEAIADATEEGCCGRPGDAHVVLGPVTPSRR